MVMKLPWTSCLPSCFGPPRPAVPECDTSHSSVCKGHGPSTTARSGILSFLSGNSCSKGTWDYSTSDGTKPRVSGARARVDADVVTLATARYLEMFTSNAKYQDESCAALSDLRRGQDSIRSVQTASDRPGSRSSMYNGASRGSRETSRQGGTHQPHPLQQQPHSPRNPASGSTRHSASLTRSGVAALPEATSPLRPAAADSGPPRCLSTGPQDGPHLTGVLGSLSPFLTKTRALADTGRSRSDRISPSAAACLLPAPSGRKISRAYTASPTSGGQSTALTASASMNELCEAAEASAASSSSTNVTGTAAVPRSSLRRSSTSHSNLAAGSVLSHRSRLHTESGGACGGGRLPACSSLERSDIGASCGVPSQPRGRLTSGANGVATRGYRRPSIVFSRDGDVTVTGLPPSCLSVGRTPRSGREGSAPACGSGAQPPTPDRRMSCALEASAPLHVSPAVGSGFGSYTRRSVDTSCYENSNRPAGGPGPIPPSFLISRSNDSRSNDAESRCPGSVNLIVTLNPLHSAHLGSCSLGARSIEAVHGAAFARASQSRHSAELGVHLQSVDEAYGESQQEEQQEQQERSEVRQQDHDTKRDAELLAAADSSSEGQRCDWGGSSLYGPSRFSNSSHFTHGNTTGPATVVTGTGYMMSNNPLEPLGTTLSPSRAAYRVAADSSALAGASIVTEVTSVHTVASAAGTAAQGAAGGAAAEGSSPHADLLATLGDSGAGGLGGESVGALAEWQTPEAGVGHGSSLLAVEARDVTSALSRLQEACMAAVAQGDMRSQRLSMDVHFAHYRPPVHAFGRGKLAEGVRGGSIGTSLGVGRIMGAVGSGVSGFPNARTGSTTLVRMAGVSATSALHGLAGGMSTGPATHSLGCCPEVVPDGDEQWENGACDGDRPTAHRGIVMDGQMLDRLNSCAEDSHASFTGADFGAAGEQDAEAEEYRTRMLNVLLCGDFLHDTHEAASLQGSDEDDDGDVEYRYGGFELGGDGVDTSYRRQHSFVEAVRKCSNPARMASNSLVGTIGSGSVSLAARGGVAAASPLSRGT